MVFKMNSIQGSVKTLSVLCTTRNCLPLPLTEIEFFFFKHHHWFLWIFLRWHSIKKSLKEGKQILSASSETPKSFAPLRHDLTMVCSELELGPQEFSFLAFCNLLVNNSLVSRCKTFLLSNLTRSQFLLSAFRTFFNNTLFSFKKRHISCYLNL